MVVIKMILIWSIVAISKITERFGLKKVGWVSGSIFMILFGDTLIPAIFHVFHVIWQIVEFVTEHFLESMFHLTPKQAEFIVAWMGILTMLGVGSMLIYKAYRYSILIFIRMQFYWNELKANLEADSLRWGFWLSIFSLSAYGATFLLI